MLEEEQCLSLEEILKFRLFGELFIDEIDAYIQDNRRCHRKTKASRGNGITLE